MAEKKQDIYRYALITSACNEHDYLPATIESVLGQRVLPKKWVIVSDGSTDRTDSIIKEYAAQCSFIRYLRKERTLNNIDSVAGAVQFFRRKCFEEIWGLQPIDVGGEDWIAEISARAKGWKVITSSELIVKHHKRGNDVRGCMRERIRQGKGCNSH